MHLGYYEAPPRKVVARDLAKLRAMGIITRDVAKEKVLSEARELFNGSHAAEAPRQLHPVA